MFDANANDRNANALNEEVPMATSVPDTCAHCRKLEQDQIYVVERTTTVNSKEIIRRVPAKNPVPCGPSENVSKPVDSEMASEGNDKTCEPETDLDGVSEKASVTYEEAVEETSEETNEETDEEAIEKTNEETDEVAIEETNKEIIEETKEETNESMMDLRDCSEKASEINDQIHALATAILWRKGGNEVCIAGTHNDWRKEPMTKLADGSFEHSCKFMHGKMHEFKFFVDGKWQFADDQPKIPDPYGSFNNVLDLTSSVEVN
ncbi:5'-AMP-activated protein kinase subunit beta-1 [Hondaea fermentalgiana]|uniref:5'-AMP-activated protein kinase subunit beta-1 n=1 Tax=Hondaea fermentalgiana TaxID=2315210 RepID=A0A2R5GEG9_9STRA|nr:5'-AMP-activated protein kinase subunit beta-1 [Hondaea fermentalgiana]|eukprot:GBG26621.1 5'-AMP-activated protein kinase subunit beta-1 [Hondaea fermentalgiana]